MSTLFGESVRNRPSRSDERIVRHAAEILFERSEDYSIDLDDAEKDRVIEDIADAIGSGDGYAIARRLERQGWDPDANMVEWLDGADMAMWDAYREAVAAWVTAEGIRPSLAVGAAVTFPTPLAYKTREVGPTLTGEITRVDEAQAEYTVLVPSLGHVRTGTGTHGAILPYEQVETLGEASGSRASTD